MIELSKIIRKNRIRSLNTHHLCKLKFLKHKMQNNNEYFPEYILIQRYVLTVLGCMPTAGGSE